MITKSFSSKIMLSSVLFFFLTQSSAALVPTNPPSSSSAPAWGYFSRYFQNATTNPCSTPGQAIVGFTAAAWNTYMTPNCSYLFWVMNGGGEIEYTGNSRLVGNMTVTGNLWAGWITTSNITTWNINGNPIWNYVSVQNWFNLTAGSIPKAASSMTPNLLGDSNIYENASWYIWIWTNNPLWGLHIRWWSATIYFQDPLRNNDIWNIDHYSSDGRLGFFVLDGWGNMQRNVLNLSLNGNVGIWTDAPGGPLEIKSASDNPLRLTQTDAADGWNYIEFNSSAGRRWWMGSDSSGIFTIGRDGAVATDVHIAGANLKVDGGIETNGTTKLIGSLQIPTGAGAGKVLTSDASGNATWQAWGGGGWNYPAYTTQENFFPTFWGNNPAWLEAFSYTKFIHQSCSSWIVKLRVTWREAWDWPVEGTEYFFWVGNNPINKNINVYNSNSDLLTINVWWFISWSNVLNIDGISVAWIDFSPWDWGVQLAVSCSDFTLWTWWTSWWDSGTYVACIPETNSYGYTHYTRTVECRKSGISVPFNECDSLTQPSDSNDVVDWWNYCPFSGGA